MRTQPGPRAKLETGLEKLMAQLPELEVTLVTLENYFLFTMLPAQLRRETSS
jgi:hypothetical protein